MIMIDNMQNIQETMRNMQESGIDYACCRGVHMEQEIGKQFIKRERVIFFWVNVGILLCLLGTVLWKQVALSNSITSRCMFHDLFHLYCPGCGGTRAVYLLLQMHPIQSFLYHPIVLLLALMLADYYIGAVITLIKRNGKRYYYLKEWFCYIVLAVILLNWGIRNLLLVKFHMDYIGDLLQFWG